MTDAIWIALGAALLYVGGELLVRHAGRLAQAWGLSPMVIGLTVVALGTSAPELAASLIAALDDEPEIALGNVIGSNIANVGLILGLTAVIAPLRARANFLRREMPVMLVASGLLIVLLLDGALVRWEGALFLGLFIAYLGVLLRGSEDPEVEAEFGEEYAARAETSTWRSALGLVAGLGLLVVGARLLVEGATSLARGFGVPELVIGMTVVALGTSLPELATCVVAALKGEPDIALGNAAGSNVLNVLLILGATVLVQPIVVPYREVSVDLWVLLGISALLWPFLVTGLRLGRREGALLLALYAAFVAYLFLR